METLHSNQTHVNTWCLLAIFKRSKQGKHLPDALKYNLSIYYALLRSKNGPGFSMCGVSWWLIY